MDIVIQLLAERLAGAHQSTGPDASPAGTGTDPTTFEASPGSSSATFPPGPDEVSGVAAASSSGEVVVVTVAGEIDLYTGPRLREQLKTLMLASPPPGVDGFRGSLTDGASDPEPHGGADRRVQAIIVDLLQVSFMDSYALGVLVWAHKTARQHEMVTALVADNPVHRKLFQVTGLSRVMPLHLDLPTALDAVNG